MPFSVGNYLVFVFWFVLRSENILNTYVRRALNKGEVLDHQ